MPIAAVAPAVALQMLRACLGSGGTIIIGKHFRDELTNEGLIIPDAWHVLRNGIIFNPAEHDVKTGDWKYRVEGHVPDGKWIAIVFCFKGIDRVFLITVFSVEAKRRSV
jgi:hypothetical protein